MCKPRRGHPCHVPNNTIRVLYAMQIGKQTLLVLWGMRNAK